MQLRQLPCGRLRMKGAASPAYSRLDLSTGRSPTQNVIAGLVLGSLVEDGSVSLLGTKPS
jgi:hypothetical protein